MRQSMGVGECEFETLGSICDRLEVTGQFIWEKRRKRGIFHPPLDSHLAIFGSGGPRLTSGSLSERNADPRGQAAPITKLAGSS